MTQMRVRAASIGRRVELEVSGSTPFRTPLGHDPERRLIAYDDPAQALEDAARFMEAALAARRAAR